MVNIIAIVAGVVVGLAAGFVIGMVYRKNVAEKEIGSAEMEATRLINEAIRSGENRKKEMLLEAKDEIHKSRTEHDKEVKERRAELSKQEYWSALPFPFARDLPDPGIELESPALQVGSLPTEPLGNPPAL